MLFNKVSRWSEKLRRSFVRSKTLILLLVVLIVYFSMNDMKVADEVVGENENSLDAEKKSQEDENTLNLHDGLTEEAQKFIKELGLRNPGEHGKAVILPEVLSEEIKTRIEEDFERNKFNSFISDMVSLNRKLPDLRSAACLNKEYSKNLPKCSVMISFHNENWMLLMRTVHSILISSPLDLIEEILLVDDASDRDYLKQPLEEYIKKLPKVRLVRNTERVGVAGIRRTGIVNSIGPILISVDCHVEVSPGWLEPILDRFTKNMNALVSPKISWINPKTMEVHLSNETPGGLGGLRLNMDFEHISINRVEGVNRTLMWQPKKSPTAIGAIHAISKEFIVRLGMFDPGLKYWGGEDVELSLKVWLCGGVVEYVPCSFTAHMYKGHTYKNPDNSYTYNTDRIAEVWLDDYIRYYYRLKGDTKHRNYGDISEQLALKKRLGCKPFQWFVDNVYPRLPIPDNIADDKFQKVNN